MIYIQYIYTYTTQEYARYMYTYIHNIHHWALNFHDLKRQSKTELLFIVVYPVTGGLSGKLTRTLSSAALNIGSELSVLTSLGRQFHSLGPFTLNNLSMHV